MSVKSPGTEVGYSPWGPSTQVLPPFCGKNVGVSFTPYRKVWCYWHQSPREGLQRDRQKSFISFLQRQTATTVSNDNLL